MDCITERRRGLDTGILRNIVSISYMASRLAPLSAASSQVHPSSHLSDSIQQPSAIKKPYSPYQLSSGKRGNLTRVLLHLDSDVSPVGRMYSSFRSSQAVVETSSNTPPLTAVAKLQCQEGALLNGRMFIPSAKESGSKEGGSGKGGSKETGSGKVDKGPYGFLIDFAMGGVSAAVSKTAAAPIERVKLLIQNQDEMLKSGRLSTPYKGVAECFTRTVKDEGFGALWRGNLANVLRYFPTQVRNHLYGRTAPTIMRGGKAIFLSATEEFKEMREGILIALEGDLAMP